jgi:opacity protein-like surface antigen
MLTLKSLGIASLICAVWAVALPVMASAAPLRLSLPASPIETGMVTGSGGILRRAIVGDDRSLSSLTLENRGTTQPSATMMTELESSMLNFSLSDPQVYKGQTRIQLGRIGGTVAYTGADPADLILAASKPTLSQQVEFSVAGSSLFDRVVSQTNRHLAGRLELSGVPILNQIHSDSLVPDSASLEQGLMSNVAGVRLSARIATPTDSSPLLAMVDPAQAIQAQKAGYDLTAEKAVKGLALSAGYSHRVGVQDSDSAYHLVDLDSIQATVGSENSVGVSGALAVNQVATIKAGYALNLDGGSASVVWTKANAGLDIMLTPRASASASYQVEKNPDTSESSNRATLGIGYTLTENALLNASYQLIDFGSNHSSQQGAGESFASAELKIKF